MADKNYEIDNPQIKDTLRSIAAKIKAVLPTGWGFLLHLFEYGTPGHPGSTFYVSSADRQDAAKMLIEWLQKQNVMVPDEINPDHPMTKKSRENWHKICALMLMRFLPDDAHFIITEDHIRRLGERDVAVAIKDTPDDGIHVFLVSTAEARRLADDGLAYEGKVS